MSNNRLLSNEGLDAMRSEHRPVESALITDLRNVCPACNSYYPCDTIKALDHIAALQARIDAAETEHQAFIDLFQTNFILGTPPELDPHDIHEWFACELRISRDEFAKRAMGKEAT